ncbi:protein CutA-like isoform X2 [Vidua chalybeata]|uniref:protein CutA-like isoform X2 n=1 Tax=Vidua chalybeata TaxID=81927 RepID=UPI0023A82748|nr:protein CutA-like isoform X2 [Vidua chalybeata]
MTGNGGAGPRGRAGPKRRRGGGAGSEGEEPEGAGPKWGRGEAREPRDGGREEERGGGGGERGAGTPPPPPPPPAASGGGGDVTGRGGPLGSRGGGGGASGARERRSRWPMRAAWAALSLLLLPGLGRRATPAATAATAATMAATEGTPGGACGSAGNGTAGDTGDTGEVSAAFVTCPNLSVATELARALVQQRLAACVNIIPGVTSVYTWQGKLEEDSEVLLMIKTRSSRVPALSDFVRSQHPYEVPEVVALPVAQGNPPYLRWVRDSVPP